MNNGFKHVPIGMKACNKCCVSKKSIVVPGYSADIDLEHTGSTKRLDVCTNCAATGVEIGLSDKEKQLIHNARFGEKTHPKGVYYTDLEVEMIKLVKEKWASIGKPAGTYAQYVVTKLKCPINLDNIQKKLSRLTIADFEVKNLPPELEWLTAGFLADLHDLVKKFGGKLKKGWDYGIKLSDTYHVLISDQPDDKSITFIVEGGLKDSKYFILPMMKGELHWPKYIPVKHVIDAIEYMDDTARIHGYVNELTGERSFWGIKA